MKQPAGRARRTNVDAALRFAAGKLCLWSLCGNAECRRMRACGGDVRACAKRLCDWLDALEDERVAAPRFELMERDLKTIAELRAYRAWRKEVEAAW